MATVKKTSRVKRITNKVKAGTIRTGKWCKKHHKPLVAIGIGTILAALGMRKW